jgi:hypothetical protein
MGLGAMALEWSTKLSGEGRSSFEDSAWRNRIESQIFELQKTQWSNVARIASLETSRDNERTRHSSTPAWIFGTIAAAVSIASFLFNLYLSGVKP